MANFHGTAARQLVLITERPATTGHRIVPPQQRLRLMQKDMYAELARRRRRAQIEARRLLRADQQEPRP